MKTPQSEDDQVKSAKVEILDVGTVSPHNKALYEAGKTLLIDSIETGRDFCKSMISTSTGAIPVYLGILTFLLPKDYPLGVVFGLTITLPAIAFLAASVIFTIGYIPVNTKLSLDILDEIDRERDRIIKHRTRWIKVGFTVFVLGALTAIYAIVISIGAK